MKLPKNYFENLTTTKYREYLKLLPDMSKDTTRTITFLIFTFVALSLFGIFAINPTLGTIFELKRQVADSAFVNERLKTKMTNLSNLYQQYSGLTEDLPVIYEAIPDKAAVPLLVGQVEGLAQKGNMHIVSLQVAQVPLAGEKEKEATGSAFTFSLDAEGSYEKSTQFVSSLANFNRIVSIESVSLTKNIKQDVLTLHVQGQGYFKK